MSSSVCRLRLSGHFSRHIRTTPIPRRTCRRLVSNAPVLPSEEEGSGSSTGQGQADGSSSRILASEGQRESRGTSTHEERVHNSAHAPSNSASVSSSKKSEVPTVELHFAQHLEGVFPSLKFPPELARRMLTHASHPAAIHGHNGVYGFLGRRALESSLMLFLTSSPALKTSHDLEEIAARALNTYVLGEHVGSQWGLGRILRWTPTVSTDKLGQLSTPGVARSAGLYKVQGDTVAAVLGGIFYQFGASEAHRIFHTRILPHLFLGSRTEGLPEIFHREALSISRRMEGAEDSSEPVSASWTEVSRPAPRLKVASQSHGYSTTSSQSLKREAVKMAL